MARIQLNWFKISTILILLLATFLRFCNYENRWGLAYDQAHDAVVARYSLEGHKIPLLGPFSSAGPFQTGGEWYWFIMAATAVYPNSVMTPWVILTLLSVVFVLLMIILGKEMISKKFGIIIGLLSAVSTAQITQSTNLTNQTPLALTSLLVVWMMIRFVKTKKNRYLFLLGLFVSLAASIHLQGVSLIALPVLALLLTKMVTPEALLCLTVGLILPWLPSLWADCQNNFSNIKNMIYYFLYDQYRISLDVLGRRWLTYAGVFWPKTWSFIIGGFPPAGYLIIIGLAGISAFNFVKKNIAREWLIIIMSFFSSVIILRYTRTPLFASYLVFLHPFVIMLTGWLIFNLIERSALVGLLIFLGITLGSMSQNIPEIKNAGNSTAMRAEYWRDLLIEKYPGKKFTIYDYNYRSSGYSLPMVLFLYEKGKLDDGGYKIGFGAFKDASLSAHPVIEGNKMGFDLWDLNSSSSAQLLKAGWSFVNPSEIYRATEEWYLKETK